MAVVNGWLGRETTTTTGTGAYTTSGTPFSGDYATFASVFANADQAYFVIHGDGDNYEVILGTWTEATKQVSRDTIVFSTNGGAAVDWAAGTKDIWAIQEPLVTTGFLESANNLSDVADAAASRGSLSALGDVGSQVIADTINNIELEIEAPAAKQKQFKLGDTDGNNRYLVRKTTTGNLELIHTDGTTTVIFMRSTSAGAVTFPDAASVRVPADPTVPLGIATKQYVDGSGLQLAAGDEILWGGAAVPSGWTLKTGATYNDRIPLVVDTVAETQTTGGDWDNSTGLSVSVNNHSLTVSQMPSHTHDVTVHANTASPGFGPGITCLTDLVASAGADSQAYTSTSQGSGSGHNHTASASSSSAWRPKWRGFAVLAKT